MFSTMLLVCYLHAKINTLALQWQLLWIYTYVKITSCWYQMYVELLGDYVFSLMHLYKCMNVMFIVPIKHKGRSRPALTRVTAPLSKGWVGVRGFSRPAWEVFSYSMLRGFFPSQADFFVMFIVLIFLVWLSITIFEFCLLWLQYYNQSNLLLTLCGSRIADGGNELYSLLAITIFKATGWCTGCNSATLRLIGNRLSC